MNMNRIIAIVALLFATSISVSAQSTELEKWVNKVETQTKTTQSVSTTRSKTTRTPNVVKKAGFYLEKSAKYQYAAIGCASVGLGLAIGSSFIGTKEYNSDDFEDLTALADKQKSDRNLQRGCLIGAGVCAVAAICCEFVSIKYKMKAGHSLRLFSTGTGGGLAYTF